MACPGSGKTYTLRQRIRRLCQTVPAEEILALSFSTASVFEINRRITDLALPDELDSEYLSKVTVKTAHGFALSLIEKREVLSDNKAQLLLRSTLKSMRKECEARKLWPDVSNSIKRRRLDQIEQLSQPSRIKMILNLFAVARASRKKVADAVSMPQFETLSEYVTVLRAARNRYASIKKTRGVIDYGDMLAQAAKAISAGATIPYTHILVDEYQDCSAAQSYLLSRLAHTGRNLMVFGDPNQAIFGFAGSSYTPLSTFLPNVKQLTLPLSRRLTAQTAALASAVAKLGTKQAIKTNREGELPVLVEDDTLDEQINNIANHIQQLIADGATPEAIVVLARTKAQLHPIEQKLLSMNIQTSRMGINRDRKNVLRVLRLVRMVEQCEKTKKKIMPEMLSSKLLYASPTNSIWTREAQALKKVSRFKTLESKYQQCAKIYLRLMGGINIDKDRRDDVNRWQAFCRDHENANVMRASVRAMNHKSVVTGSIHAAKGREWEHVLITGVTDGLLPYFKQIDDALGEERNLLYVAITRAKSTVRLYHAPTRHVPSHYTKTPLLFNKASRFINQPGVRKTLAKS